MSRRESLATQLAALRRFIAEPDHAPEPVQTNWTVIAANDNDPEEVAELHTERRWRMKPSVQEIMRQVATETIQRNGAGQVVGIGKMRFSDGTQTEAGHKLVFDKVVAAQIRMPVGALLGTKDAEEGQLGGEEDPQHVASSNDYFAEILDTLPHRYKPGGKRRRGKSFTNAESKVMLAAAYANTDMTKVTFTRYPDALPCGSPKAADSFLGMQKGKKGESGSVMWQDIVTAMADRKEWFDAIDDLKDEDRATLEAVKSAKSYVDVASKDTPRRTAFRHGRARLISANDNLMAAINKIAS